MIEEFKEEYFEDAKKIIGISIKTHIETDEGSLDAIANSSITSSRDWLDGIIKGAHFSYTINNQVVGIILVKDYWNLASLYVHPKFHKQGVATALIKAALRTCKSKSQKGYVKLNSSSFASGFYLKMGFKQEGQAKALPGGCIPYVYYL